MTSILNPTAVPKLQSAKQDQNRSIGLSDRLEERARQIARSGISALDAAHLASAEEGGADIVLTCDDIVIRRAPRLGLALRVMNPVAYFEEVTRDG